MSDGIQQAGQSIAQGIISAAQQAEQNRKEAAMLDAYYETLKNTPGAIPEDAAAKYYHMNINKKREVISKAQVFATTQQQKAEETRKQQEADIVNRQRIAETNAAIFKTAKEAQGEKPPVPMAITPDIERRAEQAGMVAAPTGEKQVTYLKIPQAEDVDLDAQGRPLVDWERGTMKSGGKIKPITQAMLAAHQEAVSQAQSAVPGMRDIDKQIQAEQTKLAQGRSGKYTLFPGVTVGTPREDVITELQARKTRLMKLYGTPSPAAETAAAAATPAPTAEPSPAPAGPAAPPAGAPAAGRITVVSPTGQVGTIPAEQLQAAVAAGYRQQ